MADYIVTDTELQLVADTLKSSAGLTGTIQWPAEFVAAIESVHPISRYVSINCYFMAEEWCQSVNSKSVTVCMQDSIRQRGTAGVRQEWQQFFDLDEPVTMMNIADSREAADLSFDITSVLQSFTQFAQSHGWSTVNPTPVAHATPWDGATCNVSFSNNTVIVSNMSMPCVQIDLMFTTVGA